MTKMTKAQKKANDQKIVTKMCYDNRVGEIKAEIKKLVKARLLNKYTINAHIARVRQAVIANGNTPEKQTWIEQLTITLADMTGSPYDAQRAERAKLGTPVVLGLIGR